MDAAVGPLVLAWHHFERGAPDRSLAVLETVTGAELETSEFWLVRACALYELSRWDEAIEAARSGLDREADSLALLEVLALAQLEGGRKKEALATIDAAIELHPDSADLHAQRALILARSAKKTFRLARYDKARAALDEALRLDPDSASVLCARAQVAVLSDDPRAQEYAADLLALEADDGQAHLIRGSALASSGEVTDALRHWEEAARLDPSDPVLAYMGRRSRTLQRPFFAPLLFLERISGGRVRMAWILVVLAAWHSGVPYLPVAAFAFWVYMWVAHAYLRVRAGKEPT
ncbi:MAG: tetratricopeptide repeat protein [Gaiellaceae bacterium]